MAYIRIPYNSCEWCALDTIVHAITPATKPFFGWGLQLSYPKSWTNDSHRRSASSRGFNGKCITSWCGTPCKRTHTLLSAFALISSAIYIFITPSSVASFDWAVVSIILLFPNVFVALGASMIDTTWNTCLQHTLRLRRAQRQDAHEVPTSSRNWRSPSVCLWGNFDPDRIYSHTSPFLIISSISERVFSGMLWDHCNNTLALSNRLIMQCNGLNNLPESRAT